MTQGENPTISYKNKLQEYFQKNKLNLPEYSTEATGTGFISTVTCHFAGNSPRTFKGHECTTKKAAEQDSAQQACIELKIE